MSAQIKIHCTYCGPSKVLFLAVHDPNTASQELWRAYWRERQADRGDGRPDDHTDMTCSACGAQFDMLGASDPREHVVTKDVSRPRISSVESKEMAGEQILTLRGVALDIGELTVRIGQQVVEVRSRSATSAEVVVPPGVGVVDVSVENQFGRRAAGAVLEQAYRYP